MARTLERLRDRLLPSGQAAGQAGSPSALRARLVAPVDGSALAVFRIGFGVIIAWEVWRAFDGNQIRAFYAFPQMLFKWWLFSWVHPLPGRWLYIAFAVVGVAAALVAAGLFYRLTAVITFLGITYWFLLEKALYLNHHYLACMLAFLLIIVPAHSAFSLDARRKPLVHRGLAPTWAMWLLRFQVGVPYFYAGVAKLNFDWLVRAEPLRSAMALHSDFPLVGQYFTNAFAIRVMAWGSTALDLFVPFLLLHRRTRALAYGFALLFHFLNSRFFEIGIFPWLMIIATTIFFDADWPRKMWSGVRSGPALVRRVTIGAFALGFVIGSVLPTSFAFVRAVVGGFGVAFLAFHLLGERTHSRIRAPRLPEQRARPLALRRPLAAFLAVWIAVQVLVPLRHFVMPGNVHWTSEGGRFAWHMLLRDKTAGVGFFVTDPSTGATWQEDAGNHLTSIQMRKLYSPDLVLEFAHYLEDYYRMIGREDVEVRVATWVSLNRRPGQRLIDSTVDLTEVRRPYVWTADWILPLEPYRD